MHQKLPKTVQYIQVSCSITCSQIQYTQYRQAAVKLQTGVPNGQVSLSLDWAYIKSFGVKWYQGIFVFQFIVINDLMYICILLARAFVQILKLFQNQSLGIHFIIYFSFCCFSCLAHVVADFTLAVRILKDKLSSGFGSGLIIPFSMTDL